MDSFSQKNGEYTLKIFSQNVTKPQVKLSLCFLTEHDTMKAYWESRGKTLSVLDIGTRWK